MKISNLAILFSAFYILNINSAKGFGLEDFLEHMPSLEKYELLDKQKIHCPLSSEEITSKNYKKTDKFGTIYAKEFSLEGKTFAITLRGVTYYDLNGDNLADEVPKDKKFVSVCDYFKEYNSLRN